MMSKLMIELMDYPAIPWGIGLVIAALLVGLAELIGRRK